MKFKVGEFVRFIGKHRYDEGGSTDLQVNKYYKIREIGKDTQVLTSGYCIFVEGSDWDNHYKWFDKPNNKLARLYHHE